MPLADGQVSVRGLVMGPGTPFTVEQGFNPWDLMVRAEASGVRAWGHGGWSGAEWAGQSEIPVPVSIEAVDGEGEPGWQELRDSLTAAFAPVGDSGEEVALRWASGGREYLRVGRPRLVANVSARPAWGTSTARGSFVALDPLIYSGFSVEFAMGLPTFEGGLTVPFTVPFTVPGVQVGGRVDLENEGTAEVGMMLRIDGPVLRPRVALARSDGEVQTLRLLFDVAAGQWVEIDTAARTVQVNGLPQASRRGQVAGEFPLVPSGVSTLRFGASEFHPAAELSGSFRHGWW